MPMTVTRRAAIRSLEGWAIATLREAGAIVACDEHGWMQDRGDPHALARALGTARDDPPRGVSTSEAIAAIEAIVGAIGDTCPDCRRPREPEDSPRFK
ncbi:hypothetical protein ACQR16_22830 [Bradyrhizobium oligotrophicum]|uniref:hypothetical protein n=1 Tax=Bradyrhizobium oligotrophicum TaxID=44255 RepID=UPI003EBBE027